MNTTILSLCATVLLPAVLQAARPPNIVFFIVDDMETTMCSFMPEGRGKVLTPNIDRLVREGVVLSGQYCLAPLCTPSRYSCLTGRYASRATNEFFLQNTVNNDGQTYVEFDSHITKDNVTLPKLLQKAGYKTGMAGKNHVVDVDGLNRFPDFHASAKDPENISTLKANYDHVCQAMREIGFDYAASVYHNNPDFLGLGEVAVQNMDWITKGGVDFIDQFHNEPFYLYFATTVPHAPSQAARSWNANPLITPLGYLKKPLDVQPPRETIPERLKAAGIPLTDPAANMLWIDDGLGALIDRLEKYGQMDNTIIFFFNDQGQDSKGTVYQGGVYDPISIVWKKGGFPCGRTNTAMVANVDFVPTILDMAGVSYKPEQFDGISFLPLLNGAAPSGERVLYCELGYTRAVIKGGWKYIALRYPEKYEHMSREDRQKALDEYNAGRRSRDMRIVTEDPTKPFSHLTPVPGGGDAERSSTGVYPGYYDKDQLYNLSTDPNEQVNLANQPKYADKLAEMKQELEKKNEDLPGTFGEFGKK